MTEIEPPIVEPYQPFPSFAEFAQVAFDLTVMRRFEDVLRRVKEEADPKRLQQAIDRATKWAAIDSGAIEGLYEVDRGFTLTVAAEASAWENIHALKGESVVRAIKDSLNGYEYVLDLATGALPITEVWIKELHEVICASQESYNVLTPGGIQEHPLPKGKYKSHPNSPLNFGSNSVHSYAPVNDTPAEMHRLVLELSSPAFEGAHPVVRAAYAHYAFVCIHPFADGNGRVSRALASVYLYRSPGVPLVIFADQKASYIETLELADAGEPVAFMQFIADRAIDTVQMVTTDMQASRAKSAHERALQLQRVTGKGGLRHDEIDAIAIRLAQELQQAFTRFLALPSTEIPMNFSVQVLASHGQAFPMPTGFRVVPNNNFIRLQGNTAGAGAQTVIFEYGSVVSMPGFDDHPDFLLSRIDGEVVCEVLLREMHPIVSPVLTYRLDGLAEEQIWVLVDRLADGTETALRQLGYLPPLPPSDV